MENVIYNLATGIDRTQFDLKLLCLQAIGPLSDKLLKIGVKSDLMGRMIPGLSMIYSPGLINYIRQSGCHIVHTHSGCWSKVASACALLPQVKLVYTDHGRSYPELKQLIFLDRIASRFTDKMVAVGTPLRDYLVNTVGLSSDKIITIRNGIDTERFRPGGQRSEVRQEFGLADSDIVIAMVARLAKVKNHAFLLRAFKQVSEGRGNVKLMIIGDGELRQDLQTQVSNLGIDGNVIFCGDRTDVPRLLDGADIATLCSDSEGISLTILEEMSFGLPVVATDVGGNPTIIQTGENGFIVPVGDIDSYVSCLSKLVDDGNLRRSIGIIAHQTVVDNWSLTAMVSQYQDLYRTLAY